MVMSPAIPSLQRGKKLAVTLLVGTALTMTILMVCFNGMATVGLSPFHNTSNDLAVNEYSNRLTATGWTPGIWGFVYVCLIVINLHLFACRFWKPAVHHLDDTGHSWPHVIFYAVWLLVTVLDISRLVLWDADVVGAAAGTTVLYALLTTAIFIDLGFAMNENPSNFDHFRIYIKNTLGLYAGWCLYETAATLAAAIQYNGALATDVAGILALVFLSALYAVFVILDFVYLSYTKQVFSVHISLLWGVVGILFSQPWTYPTIYSAVLCGVMVIVFCVKVCICLSRAV